jgi:beta-lactamase regulating signal transducer with metallopeptidase domain
VVSLLHFGLANAVMATALAVMAAGLSLVCRRPALAHALWLVVLVKLLAPPLWSVAIPWPLASPLPESEAQGPLPAQAEPEQVDPSRADLVDDAAPTLQATTSSDWETPALTEEMVGSAALYASPADVPRRRLSGEEIATWCWLSGSLIWFSVAGSRIQRFRRLLRHAQPAPPDLCHQVQTLARRLGLARCPATWLVPGPLSPVLWAPVGQPHLLLPAGLLQRLSADQLAALLVHELAHLRRGDHWVRLLEFLTTGLYWWHPVLWWARRAIDEAEETCCDAWVVAILPGLRRAYALALLETVDFLAEVRPVLPPVGSGLGQVPFLKRRLTMILCDTTARSVSWLGLLVVLGLGGALMPWMPSWAQQAPAHQPAVEVDAVPDPAVTRATSDAATNATLEKARDEVELAEAQLTVKQIEVGEIRNRLDSARRRLSRLEELHKKGVIAERTVDEASSEVETLESQHRLKQAELKEPEVRLLQARRRAEKCQRLLEGERLDKVRAEKAHQDMLKERAAIHAEQDLLEKTAKMRSLKETKARAEAAKLLQDLRYPADYQVGKGPIGREAELSERIANLEEQVGQLRQQVKQLSGQLKDVHKKMSQATSESAPAK